MTKAKAFDAANLNTVEACNKPFEVEIKHPVSGEPTGLFISVLGQHSDIVRDRMRGMASAVLNMRASGKAATSKAKIDAIEEKGIDTLVAATVGWRSDGDDGHITLGGERLEFSAANARRLYSEIIPIQEQVTEAINNLENFMPA